MNLSQCRLIRLEDFEDDDLRAVKPTRNAAEYCWTCNPSLLIYILKQNADISLISYLDADLFFFSDPSPIFAEFGNHSIMIIEHRFPEHLKYLEVNGIYNVQMMTFRRDKNGLECLAWWRERCLEWCYNRLEEGKLGDQKYLDDWPQRFSGVHVLKNIGAGIAPWNVCQYNVTSQKEEIYINDAPLLFYHFHQFRILKNNKFFYATDFYEQKKKLPTIIYNQYVTRIKEAMLQVKIICPDFKFGIENSSDLFLLNLGRKYLSLSAKNFLKRILKRIDRIFVLSGQFLKLPKK
jgi:hypothetical protein